MRALTTCLGKAGKAISPIEAKMLRASADKYRDEGFSAHESNVGAVSEAIAELEEDLESIIAQVKAYPVIEQGLPDSQEIVNTVVATDQVTVEDKSVAAREAMLTLFAQIEKSSASLLGNSSVTQGEEKVYKAIEQATPDTAKNTDVYSDCFSKIEESLKKIFINNTDISVSNSTSTPILIK